jgi:glutamine cyclotransferase
LFHRGNLYESSGSPEDIPQARTVTGIDDLATGNFDKKAELDGMKYFGEGITFLGNKVYQLTYKNRLGFIHDAKYFSKKGSFKYLNAEGWSLT